jgi:hypothetical protein
MTWALFHRTRTGDLWFAVRTVDSEAEARQLLARASERGAGEYRVGPLAAPPGPDAPAEVVVMPRGEESRPSRRKRGASFLRAGKLQNTRGE